MVKLRLRTKFLLSMVLISAGLTTTSLLLVRRNVQAQERKEIFADLHDSVSAFQNFQRERETTLSHSADLLADLPDLRALMTTQDEATIQDGSGSLWRLAGSDLFVLTDRAGTVVALHTASPGVTREMAQASFDASSNQPGQSHWWFGGQHLYQVFLKPIYFGPAAENRQLGFLVIGHEIDDTVASQLSRIAASQVAFYYDNAIVKTTLTASQEVELGRQGWVHPNANAEGEEVQLGDERFLGTSLELAGQKNPSVRLVVLKSYDQATAFLDNLNHLLLAVGLIAVLGGSGLVFFLSHTFTRPLGNLVSGVRALEKGDFTYALDARGGDEIAELTGAFDRMRKSLLKTQQRLLEAERLATIGRMASSVSHDLRHSLAAIVANAEFLCEARLSPEQREELYQEIRIAVNQMTDLIESLLEFSRTRESLRPSYGSVKVTVEHVIQTIRTHPEFHRIRIGIRQQGNSEGWFDQKKLERALFNLLLNACEAVELETGEIDIKIREIPHGVEVHVADNGRGISESVRSQLFEPFVSFGKENGTGLGLTVVQKIIQDHGGDVHVEKTSSEGTTFKLVLPLSSASDRIAERAEARMLPPLVPSKRAESE
jgi:signal transduction histidine kinase/predicted GNAT superfamily acetyltransferase